MGREAVCVGRENMSAHDLGLVRRSAPMRQLGKSGFAEWACEETTPNGSRLVRGIDRFEFSPEGIVRKDAFRKSATD